MKKSIQLNNATKSLKFINMNLKYILIVICVLFYNNSFSQDNDVNLFTGKPIVSIPIWNVNSEGLSHPISLNYNGGGVKVDAYAGKAGIGWNLSAGGIISRELRGLPDEDSVAGNRTRLGWLVNNHSIIGNLNFTSDSNFADCSDESADWNTLNQLDLYGNTIIDTEPDIFHISTAGLSLSFLFDNQGNISTIPYQDVKITPEYNPSDGAISSFEVINDNGIIYQFGLPTKGGAKSYDIVDADSSIFKRDVELFKDSLTYNAIWHLTEITSPSGGKISFTYYPEDRYDTSFDDDGYYYVLN